MGTIELQSRATTLKTTQLALQEGSAGCEINCKLMRMLETCWTRKSLGLGLEVQLAVCEACLL